MYERFFDMGIEVVTDPDRAARKRAALDAETAEEAREAVEKTNDPVRMYLREMGTVKLLDREGEVRIAKRIEQGEAKIYQALANNPIVLEEILKLLENAGPRLAHGQRAGEHPGGRRGPRRPRLAADRVGARELQEDRRASTRTSSG